MNASRRKANKGKNLAWDLKELNDLNELGRQIIVECAALEDKLMDRSYDKITDNFPSKLCSFRESTLSLLKRVTKYR